MHRIDHATATVDNLFTEGDPVGGIAATVMTDDWANAVQEEICEVIETAGLTLDKADNTQLLDALVALGVRAATTSLTGVAELATDAEVQAGTDTTRIVTPAGLASFAQALTASGGYATLPGGLIIQLGQVTAAPNPGTAVVFPIAFPNYAIAVAGIDLVSLVSNPLYTQAVYNLTTTGFTMLSTGNSELAYWIAFGK